MRYPNEVIQTCLSLRKQRQTRPDIYNNYFRDKYPNVALSGFQSNMKRWEKKVTLDEEYLENADLGYKFEPQKTTVQLDKDGNIVQSWIKSDKEIDVYSQLMQVIAEIKPYTYTYPTEKVIENKMLVIPYTDQHWGIAHYKDYEKVLERTINLIKRTYWEEINILMGEDLLHTNDFKGHTSNLTYIGEVDIPKAYKESIKWYSILIQEALKNSKEVNIKYSQSNHSDSLSWTVVQVLKALHPMANYDDEIKSRKTLKYHDIWIGFSHGDKVRGNLKDYKELFVEENLLDYAHAKVKEILLGHLHHSKETGDINGCTVRRLPSAVPTDKWHFDKGFTMANKRFQVFEYSRDSLLAIHYIKGD